MTIKALIEKVDELTPNQYDYAQKLAWLSGLDGQIYQELYETHEGNPRESFEGYGENTPLTQELLVTSPMAMDMYIFYLQACMDRENGETARYNQSITLFNSSYMSYESWYNRTHLPKSTGGRFRF